MLSRSSSASMTLRSCGRTPRVPGRGLTTFTGPTEPTTTYSLPCEVRKDGAARSRTGLRRVAGEEGFPRCNSGTSQRLWTNGDPGVRLESGFCSPPDPPRPAERSDPIDKCGPCMSLARAAFLFIVGCGQSRADPAFESTAVTDVTARGGDRAEHRCVSVTAPVVGSRGGQGACALFAPEGPDSSDPLAESGPLKMRPGEDTIWRDVELPDAPPTPDLVAVCAPTAER